MKKFKEIMNKVKEIVKKYQNIIIIAVVVLVILGTFLISMYGMPKAFKEVSYEEYLEMVKDGEKMYVYAGSDKDDASVLETFASDKDIVVYHLDTSKLTSEQLEEVYGEDEEKSLLMAWNDEEKVYSYSGDFSGYKLEKDFMKNDFIDSGVITITISDYLEIIKEKEFNLMFIGSATCGYCTMFKPELETVLDSHDVNIYYIDLSTASNEDLNKLYATDSYFTEEQWGTPLTFLYKNGKRIDVINGYVEAATVIQTLKENKVI